MTDASFGIFISTGLRNGPFACSVRSVALPSKNCPPMKSPSCLSKWNLGINAVYAAVGAFLSPMETRSSPREAPKLRLVGLGSTNALSIA